MKKEESIAMMVTGSNLGHLELFFATALVYIEHVIPHLNLSIWRAE